MNRQVIKFSTILFTLKKTALVMYFIGSIKTSKKINIFMMTEQKATTKLIVDVKNT